MKDNEGRSCSSSHGAAGKYVRYTNEQLNALEHAYNECPRPSSTRRQQLIKDFPVLAHIAPKQINVWFQNRRCREKHRKELTGLVGLNAKLKASNKTLVEQNEQLAKNAAYGTLEKHCLLMQLNGHCNTNQTSFHAANQQSEAAIVTDRTTDFLVPEGDSECETSGGVNITGLLLIAEETLKEFLAKALGTTIDWIQLPGMKPCPDSFGMVAVSHGCDGVAARVLGLVPLEPTRIAGILKDRPSWLHACRSTDVVGTATTENKGTLEVVYTQMYAPTTLDPPRDFWTLRYTTFLEDGNLVVCERSLKDTKYLPTMPSMEYFMRAEMLSSGYLIRPCEGGNCVVYLVDHMDLKGTSTLEVLRPLYQSSSFLAQQMTLPQEAQVEQMPEGFQIFPTLRSLALRMARGFNDALNGFPDNGWSLIGRDGTEDVSISFNTSSYLKGIEPKSSAVHSEDGRILCAKASMLLQNVPPTVLIKFLRKHRSEWAGTFDAASSVDFMSGYGSSVMNERQFGNWKDPSRVRQSMGQDYLELIKLENYAQFDATPAKEVYFLQLCSEDDEEKSGACAQLVFAPVEAAVSDDMMLLPSGFRLIPLDQELGETKLACMLDPELALEDSYGKSPGNLTSRYHSRSLLTVAFQFAYEVQNQDNIVGIARKYVRKVMNFVQQVTIALAASNLGSQLRSTPPATAEAHMLINLLIYSYRLHFGVDLLSDSGKADALTQLFWFHTDAIVCCTWKELPKFLFANRAGLEMLETTLDELQNILWDSTVLESGRKAALSELVQVLQQGIAYLPGGVRLSSTGRVAAYERAIAWKVFHENGTVLCIAIMFINWSSMPLLL
ncbi:hypothetical protein O6H91_21G002100 [Diphasiastrum complanatum]|uniref:Uncharacterized protein n=1 Tax=Diphasiastrum complanatum TaxID=34168 RepID=A0ACC2AH47_DIPCM|nr:hypothetical protein O6H91_21G002100 [Diphasiastrum complanatum]